MSRQAHRDWTRTERLILFTLCLAASACWQTHAQPGTLDSAFDPGFGANGVVYSVAAQGDGKLIVAGNFTSFNGTNAGRIARLNTDGTLEVTFTPGTGADNVISNVIVLSDDSIIIGGSFFYFDGRTRKQAAKLLPSGALDTSFVLTNFSGVTGTGWALQSDGRVVQSVHSDYGSGVERRQLDGSRDQIFQGVSYVPPGGTAPGAPYMGVRTQPDDRVLVGAQFWARLHAHGTTDTSFVSPSTNRGVVAYAFQRDGKILIAGSFTNFSGLPRSRIARLNYDGSVDDTFDAGTGPDSAPSALAVQPDGRIVVVGGFTNFAGAACGRVVRLNPDGTMDASFAPAGGPNGSILTVFLTQEGQIVIGGTFTAVDGVSRNRIARLNGDAPGPPSITSGPTGGTVSAGQRTSLSVTATSSPEASYQWRLNGTPLEGATNAVLAFPRIQRADAGEYQFFTTNSLGWATSSVATLTVNRAPVHPGSLDLSATAGHGTDGRVLALAAYPDGRAIIAGIFKTVNGISRHSTARLNPDGSLDTTFDAAVCTNVDQWVYCAALQNDGKVVIGGSFTNVGGATRKCIARLNSDGTVDTAFNPSLDFLNYAEVYTIAPQPDGRVVFGGQFQILGGPSYLARLNTNGTRDTAFSPILPGAVYAVLLAPDGKILAGGTGSQSGTSSLLRLRTNGVTDTSFSATFPDGGPVRSLALQPDGNVLAGGGFSYGLARFSPTGTRETNFNSGWSTWNRANAVVLQADGRILVGGPSASFNDFPYRHLVRLFPDGTLDPSFDTHAGSDGAVSALAVLPNGKVLIAGEFASVNGTACTGIARLNGEVRLGNAQLADTNFSVTVETDLGKLYTLEFSDSVPPTNWYTLPSTEGNGLLQTLTDSNASSPQRFYRVRIE